jgi:hypothetical protein
VCRGFPVAAVTEIHPELAAAYRRACTTVSDIYQHLPTLSATPVVART